MTDDTSGSSMASGALGNLSTAEMLIGGGAAWIFVVDFVIGDIIAEDYFVWTAAAMLSLGILAAIWFNGRGGDAPWKSLYGTILSVAAWGVIVLAALDLFNGLINDFSGSDARFYEVTWYIAAGVMAIGTIQNRQAG